MGSIVGAATFPLAVWLILHPPCAGGGCRADRRRIRHLPASRQHRSACAPAPRTCSRSGASALEQPCRSSARAVGGRRWRWCWRRDSPTSACGSTRRIWPPASKPPAKTTSTCPAVRCPAMWAVLELWRRPSTGAEIVLSVMPSHLVRSLYQQMLPHLDERDVLRQRHQGSGKRHSPTHVRSDPRGSRPAFSGTSRGHLGADIRARGGPRGSDGTCSSLGATAR